MNLGQALIVDEDGVHMTGALPFSVLALELSRQPVEALLAISVHTRPLGTTQRAATPYRCGVAPSIEEREANSAAMFEVVRAAGEDRLNFQTICKRARVEFTQTNRRLFQHHIDAKLVLHEGHGRAMVYWLNKKKVAA